MTFPQQNFYTLKEYFFFIKNKIRNKNLTSTDQANGVVPSALARCCSDPISCHWAAGRMHQFHTQLQGIQTSLNQRLLQPLFAEQVAGFVLIFNNLRYGYACLCAQEAL